MSKALSIAVCAALFAANATSGELFVGNENTAFARGSAIQGGLTIAGACGGSIHSMTSDGGDLFFGTPFGSIYHYDGAQQSPTYSIPSPNDARALAVKGNVLFVGGGNGTVARLNKETGAVLGTWTLPTGSGAAVEGLVLIGDMLYAGTSFGVVFRADVDDGMWNFWGTCGAPVTAMTNDATHVILAGTDGSVYRVEIESQFLDGQFFAGGDIRSLVVHGGQLLVGSADGNVRRFNRLTGALISTFAWEFGVDAMAMTSEEPGNPYCYGFACPCGNDDASSGCRNSTGAGASVVAEGTASALADDLELTVTGLPPNASGRFYMGGIAASIPFGDGLMCAGSGGYGQFRFPGALANNAGQLTLGPGIGAFAATHFGPTGQVTPAFTWHFQAWYRNLAGPCGSGFNTSTSYSVTFVP